MPKQVAKVWTETFKVRAYEVHNNGYADMPTICNYLQEAAGNHASNLGLAIDQLEEHNWTWVLSRMKVRMVRYPRWRETVKVKTWPSTFERAYTFRDFLIFDEDDKMIGKATSMWVVINLENRRPVRIPDLVSSIEFPKRERSLEIKTGTRVHKPERTDYERNFSVRYGDLDMNQHVNNVIYIEWGIEATPEDIMVNHFLRELDISFRAECYNGETVASKAQKIETTEGHLFHHCLTRQSDGKDLAVMETSWE